MLTDFIGMINRPIIYKRIKYEEIGFAMDAIVESLLVQLILNVTIAFSEINSPFMATPTHNS